jgi:hypothetical protein
MCLRYLFSVKLVVYKDMVGRTNSKKNNIQSVVPPLNFFNNIETAVDDELVHVSGFMAKAGNAVSTGLGSTKLVFEKRVVPRTDDSEVV